jgi:hypothetical protein
MPYDAIFNGTPPSYFPASSNTVAEGIDTSNPCEWVNAGQGWTPIPGGVVSKATVNSLSANNANVVTYAVPVTGLYEINFYEVSINTPTGATLPGVSATFTEAVLGTSTTTTSPTVGSISASNAVNSGVLNVYAKAGTNIVVATTGYAAGSGTALQYDVLARIQYLG